MTSTQKIFERATRHHLPDAFVSLLDRIDEFKIGTVLIYHHKPHFWRSKELDFTGVGLKNVLEESQRAGFDFETETNVLFDSTSDSSQRTVNIDLDLDGEMKLAFIDIGGDVGGAGKKVVKIDVALGSLTHISSNMFHAVTTKSLTFDVNHPVIREALQKGKSVFVISSIYQSQKVEISVTREEDVSVTANESEGENTTTPASGGATAKPETAVDKVIDTATNVAEDLASKGIAIPKEDVKGDAKAATTGVSVTNRETLSNIGFSVLKIDIGKNGVLVPQAKIGIPFHNKIYATFADAFAEITSTSTSGATTTSGASADKKKSNDKQSPSTDDKQSTDATKKENDAEQKTEAKPNKDEAKPNKEEAKPNKEEAKPNEEKAN